MWVCEGKGCFDETAGGCFNCLALPWCVNASTISVQWFFENSQFLLPLYYFRMEVKCVLGAWIYECMSVMWYAVPVDDDDDDDADTDMPR